MIPTTAHICDKKIDNILKSLKKNSMLATYWFENNYIKLNTDKFHLTVLSYKYEKVCTIIGKI